jgi:hypothetical protein
MENEFDHMLFVISHESDRLDKLNEFVETYIDRNESDTQKVAIEKVATWCAPNGHSDQFKPWFGIMVFYRIVSIKPDTNEKMD